MAVSIQPPVALSMAETSRRPPAEMRERRAVVLVGMMGSGKSAIGRRLAARLGLPFADADTEIETAAGCSIAEIFSRYGEPTFRDGERRVIARLLAGPPTVIATGGGAFMDPSTRSLIREQAISVWLDVPLPVLIRRVSGRNDRPLLARGNVAETMAAILQARSPTYGEADIRVACSDEPAEATTGKVVHALGSFRPMLRVPVGLGGRSYEILIGPDLLRRSGQLLAGRLASPRAVVVTDSTVARLHLEPLMQGLRAARIEARSVLVTPGEASKGWDGLRQVMDGLLQGGVDRRTAVLALGGGVVGDLAGFAAAIALRGLPFVQVPTTLLAQVDSAVGGKTAIDTPEGKNLVGAFHQPVAVLADSDTLATLPIRERRAGYAEVVKYGLLGDPGFFGWCEAHGRSVIENDSRAVAEAVRASCEAKARVVAADEFETDREGGRALLNLGHTFGHALEVEAGFDGGLLHGEAVSVGMGLAFLLSARLGLCGADEAERVIDHLGRMGLPARLADLQTRFDPEKLVVRMRSDKKAEGGTLTFVLANGIGRACVVRGVDPGEVRDLLQTELHLG